VLEKSPIFPPEVRINSFKRERIPEIPNKRTNPAKIPAKSHFLGTTKKVMPKRKKTKGTTYMTLPIQKERKLFKASPPFPDKPKKLKRKIRDNKNIGELKMYLFNLPGKIENCFLGNPKNSENAFLSFLVKGFIEGFFLFFFFFFFLATN